VLGLLTAASVAACSSAPVSCDTDSLPASKTVFVDIDDRHGNVSHGSHMACLAGSIMAIQWGFAGMTWRGGVLGFRPVLPKAWTSFAFSVLWRGRLIELEIHHSKTRYTLLHGEPLEVNHHGTPFTLSASALEDGLCEVGLGRPTALHTTHLPATARRKASTLASM